MLKTTTQNTYFYRSHVYYKEKPNYGNPFAQKIFTIAIKESSDAVLMLSLAEPNALCPAYNSLRSYGKKQKQRQVVFFSGRKTAYTEESKLLPGEDTWKIMRTDLRSSAWKEQIWGVMAKVFGDVLW